ncbi:MAG TPA: hypothetical protein VFQ35_20340, partial [Polyangiaceae bacterium]|nr:hypothetical protein [Polyangiaceae bacterium]
ARAHGLGFEIARAADGEADVRRFVTALRAALAEPVRPADPALARAQREVEALRALTFSGPGEAAVSACSGEIGFERGAPIPDFTSPAGTAELEATRASVFRTGAAAFAALGSTSVLDAATRALGSDAPWPRGDADDDPWPEADGVFVDTGAGPRRLSIAIRSPDTDAVLATGLALRTDRSALSQRLDALSPPWRLERASAVARLRGACLRLDLAPPKGDPAPSPEEIARAALVAEISVQEALAHTEPGAADETVLRPSNPLRAAGVAAWRALLRDDDEEKPRSVLSFASENGDAISAADVGKALAALRARQSRTTIEVSSRPEAGQGELWLLLASPCGSGLESAADAGAVSLALRSMALGGASEEVELEPWVTSDGAGLLAHAARKDARETALAEAERVARVLGRAFAQRLGGAEIGTARAALLTQLGGRPFVGWSTLLEGLAPSHPSWLEPRGLWATVSELSGDELERTRRFLLAGPLRLAVLANRGEAQVPAAARTLEDWLMPARGNVSDCSLPRGELPRRGEVRVRQAGAQYEGAYVGVVLAQTGLRGARAAELAELLLNHPRSAMQRGVTARAPGASATARALASVRRPALVVEIRAMPEQLSAAIAVVRAGLDELGRGEFTNEAFAQALARLGEREAEERFDPRRRIVDLFRGASAPELDAGSVKSALSSFTMSSQWTVSTAPPP